MDGPNGFPSVNPLPANPYAPTAVPSPPGNTNGSNKRKRAPPKFYAVRVGKEPGIYHTWAECLDQVRGFPKAAFKSFTSLTDAQAFLNDEDGCGKGSSGLASGKFYGVREGRVPGVYSTWPEVLEQITGWKGPKHKVFKTRAEAELFVNGGGEGIPPPIPMLMNGSDDADPSPRSKKAKTKGIKDDPALSTHEELGGGEYSPGSAPLPSTIPDNFDTSIILSPTTGTLRYKTAAELSRTKYQAVGPAPEAPIRIYTDGSTLSNGRAESISGVGVYFGPRDKRNISEPLEGKRQTNQRAELTAVMRALEVAPRDKRVVILTDSMYAINCVTVWFRKWRQRNWHNSSNKPVENKDLIQKVLDLLEERKRLNAHRFDGDGDANGWEGEFEDGEDEREAGSFWDRGPGGVAFQWVKGHAKDAGNEAADELAVNGARVAKELGEDVDLDA